MKMSEEKGKIVEDTDYMKNKKLSKETLEKMNRAAELRKIVDEFNKRKQSDCSDFIKYNESLKEIKKVSKQKHKYNKKEMEKDDQQKKSLSIDTIKEIGCNDSIKGKTKKKKSTWRLITMITLNGIFFFVELITGISTHSLALQTDAFNMLSDEASVIIGLVVHQYSKKTSTPRMSFGYIRAETIGGLCNSVFMYAVALTILLDAIELFVDPYEIEHSLIFLIVGILGLLVNLIGIIVFNTKDNDNIKGVFIHALGDFLGSVGVLISALVQNFCDSKILKNYIDPVISIIIAVFLTIGTTSLFKKTVKIVAEVVPDELDIEEIKKYIFEKVSNIEYIHDFHVWELADDIYMAVMHVTINLIENRKKVIDDITNYLMAYGIYSTTIQIECKSDFALDFQEKRNHCAFASQYNHKLRIFNSKPVYQHLIGCKHEAIIDESFENSYGECNENSNSETVGQNNRLIVKIGTSRSGSCSNIEKIQNDQYDDNGADRSDSEIKEKI